MRFPSRTRYALVLACTLAACGGGGDSAPTPAPEPNYPATRSGDDASVHFGQRVADPYRWLEDTRSTPVIDWVRAQNAYSTAQIEGLPLYERVHARLQQLDDYERVETKRSAVEGDARTGQFQQGQVREGRFYYQWQRLEQTRQHEGQRRRPNAAQGRSVDNRIYVAAEAGQVGKLLVDVGLVARNEPDDAIELLGHQLSADGRFLAYRLKRNHADIDELHLIDLQSARRSPTVVSRTLMGSMQFEGARLLFVEALDITHAERSSHGAQAIQSADTAQPLHNMRMLYRTGGDAAQASLGLGPVIDGKLYLEQSTGTNNSSLLRLDLAQEGSVAEMFLDGQGRDTYSLLDEDPSAPGRLLVQTSQGSALTRVVSVDPAQAQGGQWRHILPAQPSEVVETVTSCGRYLYAKQWSDAANGLTRYTLDGSSPPRPLAMPAPGDVPAVRCAEDGSLRFMHSTLAQPPQVLRYAPEDDRVSLVETQVYLGHDPQRYEVRQLMVPASDGAQIPVTMAHRKGLVRDGSAPALMYVYGGFNVPVGAGFTEQALPLLESGGIYLVAHVRGGAERGQAWYDAGRLFNKPRTYADLADVARYLAAQGYTSAARMGVTGGSNGGTSAAAAALLYPELFAVALPLVGVHDLTRFPLFTSGFSWRGDYGDPEVQAEFSNLMGFSPLHNVKARRYPAMYVITGQNDQRVLPAHSYKLAAMLQNQATGPGPYLLHSFDKSGHQIEGEVLRHKAHEVTFFMTHTGTVFTPAGQP